MMSRDVIWLLFLAGGIFAMLSVSVYFASRKRIRTGRVLMMFFFCALVGIMAGRLSIALFWESPADLMDISRFYTASSGVVAGSLAGAYTYCRIRGLPLWRYLDIFALGGGLLIFFGRLGCYFRGCCMGKPSEFLQQFGIAAHPFQLYDAMNGLIAAAAVFVISRRKRPEGALILVFLMSYSAIRFAIEFFRVDPTFWYLTYSQYFYLAVLLIAALKSKIIYTRWQRAKAR